MKLLSVEAARARMVQASPALPAETVAIEEAAGRVLTQAVIAPRDQPPFDSSAMDGWAVRRGDALGARAALNVVGESSAGHGFAGTLGQGQAVRIFTGGALPEGADMVVIQEDAEREGESVRVGPLAGETAFVRARGGDFRAGDRLLEVGLRLDAWRLALAAAAGLGELQVARRPRVAVLCTGEELVRPPRQAGPFQIYESGSAALCALAAAWGAQPQRLEPALDSEASVIRALDGVQADLIVTVGGASVGDYDVVKPALTTLGLELSVASVNVRPGKPTSFGVLADGRRVLGLPGNPSSAMACAELFMKPVILALQGADPEPRQVWARLGVPLPANGGREHLMRATLRSSDDGGLVALPFDDQDSGWVGVFAKADALLRRPSNAEAAAVGQAAEVLPLERL